MIRPGEDIPLLTVAEAAKRVRVSERTIGRWIRDGLPFIPNQTERLIRLDHLQAKKRETVTARRSHAIRVLLAKMSDTK